MVHPGGCLGPLRVGDCLLPWPPCTPVPRREDAPTARLCHRGLVTQGWTCCRRLCVASDGKVACWECVSAEGESTHAPSGLLKTPRVCSVSAASLAAFVCILFPEAASRKCGSILSICVYTCQSGEQSALQRALFEHLLYAGCSEFEGEFITAMNILVITHFFFA